MAQAGPAVVTGPTITPPLHSLVVSGQTVRIEDEDPRWERGFTWMPETCIEAELWDPDCDAGEVPGREVDKPETPPQDCDDPLFVPYTIEVGFECSPLGRQWIGFKQRVQRMLEAATAKAVEHEFWTGDLNSANAHLTMSGPAIDRPPGATVLNSPSTPGQNPNVSPVTAVNPLYSLALLQEGLADCGPGGRGMLHYTTLPSSLMSAAGYFEEEGPRLVTKGRGDIVVVGSGYPGTGPEGHAQETPPANTVWAFATGMVQIRLSPIQVIPDEEAFALDRRRNSLEFIAERQAAATWESCCCLFAVLVDIAPT